MQYVERCHLKAVQLYGRESPELVLCLCQEDLCVIKALFFNGTTMFMEAAYKCELKKNPKNIF